MSCNYAEGLSPYENKGKCGQPEKFDSPEAVCEKVETLTAMMRQAGHVVFHTGAGVSTSAGIPDFRGPKGVWTLEKKGLKPDINVSWDEAKPTFTHRAISALQKAGYVQYVITQNIDGLHLKSGFPRSCLSELHGNMFVHQCNNCKRQFVRQSAVPTVGEKCLDIPCPGTAKSGRGCRGRLYDNILDWEGSLPDKDLELAEMHSEVADLSICLGTTLQIVPSGNLPTWCKKHGGKLAICNLQPTKHDRKADVIINTYVDDVLIQLCKNLGVTVSEYSEEEDPTKFGNDGDKLVEWTIPDENLKRKCLLEKVKTVKKQIQKAKVSRKRSASPQNGSAKKSQKESLSDQSKTVGEFSHEASKEAVPDAVQSSGPEESLTDISQAESECKEERVPSEDQNSSRASQTSKSDEPVAETVRDLAPSPGEDAVTEADTAANELAEANRDCECDEPKSVPELNSAGASELKYQEVTKDIETDIPIDSDIRGKSTRNQEDSSVEANVTHSVSNGEAEPGTG